MKKKIFILMVLFGSLESIGYANISDHYIEVRGESEKEVVPNEIFVSIILSENEIGSGKLDAVEKKMISSFKEIGVNTEQNLRVKDMFNKMDHSFLRKDVDIFKSYELRLTKLDQISQALKILQKLGISQARISRQSHTDIEKIEKKVRIEAVIDAKEKAQTYLKPLNQQLGKAIYIVDQRSYVRPMRAEKKINLKNLDNNTGSVMSLQLKKIKIESSILIRFKLD